MEAAIGEAGESPRKGGKRLSNKFVHGRAMLEAQDAAGLLNC
jgi:hypothetical protein